MCIPEITDPLGRSWRQPPLDQIAVDDTHALMSETTFKQLAEYSTSMPTGVYVGKMWSAVIGGTPYLRWYGRCEKPGHCSNNQREVIFA